MPKSILLSWKFVWRTLTNMVPRVCFAVWRRLSVTPVIFYTRARTRGALLLLAALVLLSGIGLAVLRPQTTEAATSSTINFQARLQTSAGAIVPDGNYNLEFKLYNVSSGGSALWTETRLNTAGNGVQVVNGYLSVNLGSVTAFGAINWDQNLWLTMNVGNTNGSCTPFANCSPDGEMSPRLSLTALPYAFRAGQLALLTGSNTSTLGWATQTAANSLLLPNEGGTLCVQGSSSCNFAAASGSSNYIQNTASPQTANFNITGNGTIGGNLAVTGNATVSGNLITGSSTTYSLTRTLPTTVNNEVDIGSFGGSSGANAYHVSIVVSDSGFSAAKEYVIPVQYNMTSGAWQLAQPLSDTGPYSGNDFALDIRQNVGTTYMRLRRTAGATAGTARVTIVQEGSTVDAFTPSTATSSVSAPTAVLATTPITQGAGGTVTIRNSTNSATAFQIQNASGAGLFTVDSTTGKIGVNVAPSSANFEVQGGSGVNLAVTTTTNSSSDIAYMSFNNRARFGYNNGNVFIDDNSSSKGFQLNLNGGTALQVNATTSAATFKNATNSTTGFQVQNASSNPILDVDTTNGRIGIGLNNPTYKLEVASNVNGAEGIYLHNTNTGSGAANQLLFGNDGSNFAGLIQNGQNNTSTYGGANSLNLINASAANLTLGTSNTVQATIASNGATTFKNSSNSSTAFQVQNSSSAPIFKVDTSTSTVTVARWLNVTGNYDGNVTLQLANASSGDNATSAIQFDTDDGIGSAYIWQGSSTYASYGGASSLNIVNMQGGNLVLGTDGDVQATIASNGATLFKNSVNSATAFQVQNTSSNQVLGVDTSANQVVLGKAGTLAGKLVFTNATNSNLVTITSAVQANAVALTIPADTNTTDTICLQTLANCGGGGGTAFVQNGNSFGAQAVLGTNDGNSLAFETNNNTKLVLDTSGNLQLQQASTISTSSGNLTIQAAGTSTLSLDTAGAGTINLGTNATTITLGAGSATETVNIGNSTGNDTINIGSNTGSDTVNIGSASNATTLNAYGTTLVKSVGSNSTTAFQIQNASGTSLLTADTANMRITTGGDLNVGLNQGNRLFSDSFESGNYGLWSYGTAGTAPTMDSTIKHDGKYAAKVALSSSTGYAGTKIASSNTVYARLWLNLTSASTDIGILSLWTGSPTTTLNQVTQLGWQQSTGKICVYNEVAGSSAGCTASAVSTSAWHLVELRGTVATASTGVLTLWVDGTQAFTVTNANNGTAPYTDVIMGFHTAESPATATYYVDDLAIDTAANGPASSLNVQDSLHVGGTTSFGSNVLVQTSTNSTSAFQIQNASGSTLFNADTSQGRVTINTDSSTGKFDVQSGGTSAFTVNNVAGTSYASTVLADSPIAYWRLNETSGTTATDATGSSNGTYMNTPTLGVTGPITSDTSTNYGASFAAASTEYVDVNPGLTVNDTFTLEGWIKRSGTGVNETIISTGSDGTVQLRISSSNIVQLLKTNTAGLANSSTTITDTNWHYVVATKNGSSIHIYVDGADVTSSPSNSTVTDDALKTYIGAKNGGGGGQTPQELANSALSNVAVYTTELSAATIAAHYAAATASAGGVQIKNSAQTLIQNITNSTTSFQIQNSSGASLLTGDTSNMNVVIGSATTDSTAVYLVLDSYNVTADPTGVTGAMYYNTSTNSFRCYQNSNWQNCGPQIKKLSSDDSNSSTTPASVSDLSFAVTANTDYSLKCTLFYTSSATGTGIKFALTGPSSPTAVAGFFTTWTTAGASGTTATLWSSIFNSYDGGFPSTGVAATNTNYAATLEATFRNGSNAGTLALRHASETANATVLKAGSSCQLSQL